MKLDIGRDEELLRAIEYCENSGLKEAADWIRATIPFLEFGLVFRMSKKIDQSTHGLVYEVEACYADEKLPTATLLPRRSVLIPAVANEAPEVSFYAGIISLTHDIFERKLEKIRNKQS